jgi:hypothetical protein
MDGLVDHQVCGSWVSIQEERVVSELKDTQSSVTSPATRKDMSRYPASWRQVTEGRRRVIVKSQAIYMAALMKKTCTFAGSLCFEVCKKRVSAVTKRADHSTESGNLEFCKVAELSEVFCVKLR